MDDRVKVYFDDECRLRLLDPAKFTRAEELEKEAGHFVESTCTLCLGLSPHFPRDWTLQ